MSFYEMHCIDCGDNHYSMYRPVIEEIALLHEMDYGHKTIINGED